MPELVVAVDTEARTRKRAGPSGARSSALIAAASVVATILNYAFLLTAGRLLGSHEYGALAALMALLTLVLLPTGAVQLAVSREVSRRLALGEDAAADAFTRAAVRVGLIATAPIVAIGLVLVVPLREVLNIDSTAAVALALTGLTAALALPITTGALQGYHRFQSVAAMYVLPFALRVVLLGLAAGAGYRLRGAVLAAVLGAITSAGIGLALLRDALRRGAEAVRPNLQPFLRYLWPVLVGVIGVAVLTNVDLLVVKARFSGDDAGEYAAAAAFAKVAFFLPTTILAVLFPRTAARHARGEPTEDILGRSLIVTAAFGVLLSLFYAMTGRGLVDASFGHEFADGGELLVVFTLAMTLFAIANVFVGFDLSQGQTRYAWLVAGSIPVQIALLATIPDTLHGIIWIDVLVGGVLVAAHEVVVGSTFRAVRVGAGHFLAGVTVSARAVIEMLVVLLGATALACTFLWPVVRHFGSTIVGYPGTDSTGTIAWLWEQRHESGFHLLGVTHHTLTAAPFGWDESNALNLQVLLVYYPTYLLGLVVGEVAAFNVATIAGYAFSGAAMYWLVRYLGCGRLVAAWAGIVYVIFPWHVARAEHASLLHLEIFPLLVLALVAAVRKPSWTRFGFVGLANLAAWLTSGYFGPMAAITTVAFAAGAAFAARRRPLELLLAFAGGAVAAVAVIGVAAVASGTNAGAGLQRQASDLSVFGLRPFELVVPPERSRLVGDHLSSFWSRHTHGSNATEITTYLGLLTLALAVFGLIVTARRPRELSTQARIAVTGLVVAFAAGLAFAAPNPSFGFAWMPSRMLYELVPAFRVTSRWDAQLMACVLPIAALGLERLTQGASARSGRRTGAIAVAMAAIAISLLELTITAPPHFRTVPVPPEYAVLDRLPKGILAEYPLGYSDVFRLWQREHGRPLLNGARPDTPGNRARLVLLDPADPGTASALSLLGVTAIGFHPNAHVDSEIQPREPAGVAGYRLVGRYADGASLWRVVAAPAPALVTFEGGFSIPQRRDDGFVGSAFDSSAGVGVLDFTAKRAGVIRLVFDASPPKDVEQVLRLTDESGEDSFTLRERTHIEALVEVPEGLSQIFVKTDPAATSDEDAIFVSAPRAEPAAGEPTLHAALVSSNPGF